MLVHGEDEERGGQSGGGEMEESAMEPGYRRGGGGAHDGAGPPAGTSANGRIHAGHREAAGSAQAIRTRKRGPGRGSSRCLRIRARAVLEMVLPQPDLICSSFQPFRVTYDPETKLVAHPPDKIHFKRAKPRTMAVEAALACTHSGSDTRTRAGAEQWRDDTRWRGRRCNLHLQCSSLL
jgi:hypothetical protein